MRIILLVLLSALSGWCAEQKLIPLESIVATSRQPDLKHLDAALTENDPTLSPARRSATMAPFWRSDHGASNLFLVDAPDIYGALWASQRVVVGAHPADFPAHLNQPNPPRGNCWCVVYLGVSHSEPRRWKLLSVRQVGNSLLISARQAQPMAATNDLFPYWYWIPVGRLEGTSCRLELLDAETGITTLMRMVEIRK